MYRKLSMMLASLLLASLTLAWPAVAQDVSINTCPSQHPLQYSVPTDATNEEGELRNYQIPGGDYHIESVTPEAVTLCGEAWTDDTAKIRRQLDVAKWRLTRAEADLARSEAEVDDKVNTIRRGSWMTTGSFMLNVIVVTVIIVMWCQSKGQKT